MDFAIIETGGKQYKITPNSNLEVEKLSGEIGDKVVFDKVLMIVSGDQVEIGDPYLKDTSFEAVIEDQKKGQKVNILRFRAKSRHRRRAGHRQKLTQVNFADKPAKAAATKAAKKPTAKAAPKTTKAK